MDDKHVKELDSKMQASADMIEAKDYTLEQLRQVLFGESQLLPRRIAIQLLARKSYPEKLDDLRRVLDDEQQDARTRHAAATALGRLGTPEAMEALRSKLDSKDRYVLRGIRQALEGKASEIGAGEREMEAAPGEEPRWNQRLSAYRQGTPGMEFPFPAAGQFLPVDLEKAQSIPSTLAPAEGMSTALEQISQQAAGLNLVGENALSLRCAGRDLMVLLTGEASASQRRAEFTKRKTVFGVVAVRFGLETQAWSPKYYILTQPGQKADEFQIFLTSTRGRLEFAGTAEVKGERTEFSLRAVSRPGATPAEMSGVFEAGVLRLERLLVSETSLPSDPPRRLGPRT